MATPTQIEIPGTNALIRRAPDPLEILQSAIEKNMNPETLKQLMDLQERWEANEAKKEFIEAMNAFKANPPTIRKNKHVKAGAMEFDHATLDHVCEEVMPRLSAHGISHRWKVAQADARIKVTCILTHQRGHSEETTMEGPADTSGSKNSIQAIASSVHYLERYTLLAATGLAAEGIDDDGKAAGNPSAPKPTMDAADKKERLAFFPKCSTLKELHDHWHASYGEAKKVGDKAAMDEFNAAKDERKKSLLKDAVKP